MKKVLQVLLIIGLVLIVVYLVNSVYKYSILTKSFDTVFDLVETENFKLVSRDKVIGARVIYSMGEENFIIDDVEHYYYIIKEKDKYYEVNNELVSYSVFDEKVLNSELDHKEKMKRIALYEILAYPYGEYDSVEDEYKTRILKWAFDFRNQITNSEKYIVCFDKYILKIDKETLKIVEADNREIEYSEFDDIEIFENSSIENLEGYELVERVAG